MQICSFFKTAHWEKQAAHSAITFSTFFLKKRKKEKRIYERRTQKNICNERKEEGLRERERERESEREKESTHRKRGRE